MEALLVIKHQEREDIMDKFIAYAQDTAKAADYCKAHFPDTAAATMELADELMQGTFTFREHWEMERTNVPVTFPAKIAWELIPSGDPEWIYALNRHTAFVILAKTYLYTKDDKYAKRFEAIATDWLDNAKLSEKTKNGCWRSLEAGLRIENWLRAMLIFEKYGKLSQELKQRLDESLHLHAQYLTETSGDFQALSNWGVLQDHGLFLLGLYFNDKAMADMAAQRLTREIHLQVFRDGTQWEQSPMYHCEVLHCFLDTVLVAKQNGYELPQELLNSTHNMAIALGKWIKPNGHIPMQGDSDDIMARDILAQAAVLFDDGLLKFYAAGTSFEENIWDFGEEFNANLAKIHQIQPKLASCCLEDSGNYFLRASHSPLSPWLRFHCGCLGSGHGHADQLHIDLSAFGEDILIDSGRFTYVDSEVRRTLKSVASHNTTRVDKLDFSVPINSWGYSELAMPIKGNCCFTDKADYVRGAHLGYQNLASGGIFTSRRILFVKPDIFIINDEFYGNGVHQYEQFFHFSANGKLKPRDNGVSFEGKKCVAELINVSGDEARYGSIPASREYNTTEECREVCFLHTGNGFTSVISVISVAELGEECELTAQMIPVTACKHNIVLSQDKAQAVQIVKNGIETVVLLCHSEVVSEVDLLEAGNYKGYGKAVVFGDNFPKDGEVLEW